MNANDIELSKRLHSVCLKKGITNPRYVAQDHDGKWWYYGTIPKAGNGRWYSLNGDHRFLLDDQPNPNWRETLMEWNSMPPLMAIAFANAGIDVKHKCPHCGK